MRSLRSFFYALIVLPFFIVGCTKFDKVSSEKAKAKYYKLAKELNPSPYYTNRLKYFEVNYKLSQLLPFCEFSYDTVLSFYHHLGYAYRMNNLHRESLNNYKLSAKYYNTHKHEFSDSLRALLFGRQSFDYRGMAINYQYLGLLDSAYLTHQINIKFVENNSEIWRPAAYNDFGIFLIGGVKDTLAALKEFNKAYKQTLNDFPTHPLVGSIRDNLGKINLANHNFKEGQSLFQLNYDFYKDIITNPEGLPIFDLNSAKQNLLDA